MQERVNDYCSVDRLAKFSVSQAVAKLQEHLLVQFDQAVPDGDIFQ
jgi:hypothetical protein